MTIYLDGNVGCKIWWLYLNPWCQFPISCQLNRNLWDPYLQRYTDLLWIIDLWPWFELEEKVKGEISFHSGVHSKNTSNLSPRRRESDRYWVSYKVYKKYLFDLNGKVKGQICWFHWMPWDLFPKCCKCIRNP